MKSAAYLYVFVAIVLVSCGPSAEQVKQKAMERGASLLSKGDYPAASIEFRKAIQADSQLGEAHYKLGLAQVRMGDPNGAESAFTKALILMPNSREVKAELGQLYITSYLADPRKAPAAYQRAVELAEELVSSDPDSFAGLSLQGYIAMADGRPAVAVEKFAKAHDLDPTRADIATLLVQNLLREQRPEEAEALANQVLSSQKHYGPLYDVLYGHYMAEKRIEKAEAVLQRKTANNPDNSFFVIQLARHYLAANKRDQIEGLLATILHDDSRFPEGRQDAGDFYVETRQWDNAVEVFREGVRLGGDRKTAFQKRLAGALMLADRRADAESALNSILAEHPRDLEALASRASLRAAKGTPEDLAKAVEDLKILTEAKPNDLTPKLHLARAYGLLGQTQLALTHYREVINSDPYNLEALQALAHTHLELQQFQDAQIYADRILEVQPNDASARLVRTATLAAFGDFEKTRLELAGLLRDQPDLKEAKLQMGMLNILQKHFLEAEKLFREVYRPGEGDVRALKGLVEIHAARKEWNQAIALLKKEAERHPESVEIRQILADTAGQGGSISLAIEQYEELDRKGPLNRVSVINLGSLYHRTGRLDEAAAQFRRAKQMNAGDPLAPALLAKVLEDAGRNSEAISSYRESLRLGPDNASVLNNLAYLLAETGGSLEEALQMAWKAAQNSPGTVEYVDTVGFIYLKQNDFANALRVLKSVRDKGPEVPSVRIHLAEALVRSGDAPAGRAEAQAAAKLATTSAERSQIESLLHASR